MALIQCSECGHQISDRARICPYCGCDAVIFQNETAHQIIYEQDLESARFQDRLRWSRFQTVAVIQGGYLYACYVIRPGYYESLAIAILGTVLILVASVIAVKNEKDFGQHLDRAAEFEDQHDQKYEKTVLFPRTLKIRGGALVRVVMIVLVAFNLAVIVHIFCTFSEDRDLTPSYRGSNPYFMISAGTGADSEG